MNSKDTIDDRIKPFTEKLSEAEEKDRKCTCVLVYICMAVGLGSSAGLGYQIHNFASNLRFAHKQCVSDKNTVLETQAYGKLSCPGINNLYRNWFSE